MEEFHFQNCGAILIGFIVSIVLIRLSYVLYWSGRPIRTASQRVSTLIVLGSGGHTAEMLSIVNALEKERFVPRIYIAAGTDNMSLQKARVLEESLIQKGEISSNKNMKEAAYFKQIYRSREVGQSYLTSIYTTLVAILHALWLMLQFRPEVIICNGPGTCIPICLVAFIFKVVGVRWSSIFYIESIARVKRLSLSGFLLYKLHLADQFYAQWPQLQMEYQKAHYVGCLM
ncbi:UDP-N-acetylglucosamine transferase subunit ALG14 homolog [Phalaenopsis equestris]|uniref:UDP-N-acetylglucosamine transferase subunit ALG14 homolog n=1 Tax=Phalaenopsis equestris TaxID=78828 RepID=UPI0009E52798|nr:UDP-N-acetylglucosamine transferase subunit ALG14 homolog [Phalaenopsis equestris]XP_020590784.1 UDP-N-acetylglucosamine transferase subunit ALG14 homolog [Phalaenopsis equestris]